MSQDTFSAQAKGITVSVTDAASTAANLPAIGNSVRIVNESADIAFVSITTAGTAAALPTGTAAAVCTPVRAASEVVLSIDGMTQQKISAICRSTKTATLTVHVCDVVI